MRKNKSNELQLEFDFNAAPLINGDVVPPLTTVPVEIAGITNLKDYLISQGWLEYGVINGSFKQAMRAGCARREASI